MVQVWKMPLKSGRPDIVDIPDKVDAARNFCVTNGFTGIGWERSVLEDGLEDPRFYESALASEEQADGASIRSALSAHRAFSARMEIGDFVWCRHRGDIYYLGRITGPWIYRTTDPFADFDLYQVRTCHWKRIGPADLVPGPVKNAFAGRGSAISRILAEHESVLFATTILWNRTANGDLDELPMPVDFSLSALGHDDLEDLVGLYLQVSQGWYIVPSTAKRSTPVTEYVLRNAQQQRAYLQVKSGASRVDIPAEVPEGVDVFFLFHPSNEPLGPLPARTAWVNCEALKIFVHDHRFLLSPFVQECFAAV